MERDCRTCEWFDRQRPPGAGPLARRVGFCTSLGFFLFDSNLAPECRMYRPRPGVTTKEMGR